MAVNVTTDKNSGKQNALVSKVLNSKKKASDSFLAAIKTEFGKITWTSREELVTYTKAVVGSTVVFGLGVYIVDLGIQFGLGSLGTLFRLIFG